MKPLWVILPALLFLVVSVALASENLQLIKANEFGEIVLEQRAKFGNTVLPPGTYFLHSDVTDTGDHQVHFQQETRRMEVYPQTSEIVYTEEVARVRCRTDIRMDRPDMTAIYYTQDPSGIQAKEITVKGEMHLHVF